MIEHKYTLDKAREAVQLGNYANAVEIYNNFFKETFKNSAKYGVRLSYCLNEWASLGEIYPQALKKLENIKNESLLLFKKDREPERFHDYFAICGQLKSPELPHQEFLRLHATDKTLSSQVIPFIWDELIENKEWEICIAYLDNPLEKYESYLHNLDVIFKKHVRDDSTSFEKEIVEHSLNWYIKVVTNILLILKYNNHIEAYNLIRQRISSDLASRELSKLEILIDRKMDAKFIQ